MERPARPEEVQTVVKWLKLICGMKDDDAGSRMRDDSSLEPRTVGLVAETFVSDTSIEDVISIPIPFASSKSSPFRPKPISLRFFDPATAKVVFVQSELERPLFSFRAVFASASSPTHHLTLQATTSRIIAVRGIGLPRQDFAWLLECFSAFSSAAFDRSFSIVVTKAESASAIHCRLPMF